MYSRIRSSPIRSDQATNVITTESVFLCSGPVVYTPNLSKIFTIALQIMVWDTKCISKSIKRMPVFVKISF